MAAVAEVNGPEEGRKRLETWSADRLAEAEEHVRRLRQRIFTASKAGDGPGPQPAEVDAPVPSQHAGQRAAGDGSQRWPQDGGHRRAGGAAPRTRPNWPGAQRRSASWLPRPVKRVYIPKATAESAPLGIPVIIDRCLQSRVATRGTRVGGTVRTEVLRVSAGPWLPGRDRSHLDTCQGPHPERMWALDADLAAAFDRIDHDHSLPARLVPSPGTDPGWLKAGVIEGEVHPDRGGNPARRGDHPLLMNVALHGMEQAAGVRYQTAGAHAGDGTAGSPVLIRYADDLVALCHTRSRPSRSRRGWRMADAQGSDLQRGQDPHRGPQRRIRLPRGSTSAVTGQAADQAKQGGAGRIRERLAHRNAGPARGQRGDGDPGSTRSFGGGRPTTGGGVQPGVPHAGHPPVATHLQVGQVVSPEQAEGLDHRPVLRRVQQCRRDRWVFGDRDSGAYLVKFAWTNIVRHPMVKGNASPDDPALADYWANRREGKPPMDQLTLRLLDTGRPMPSMRGLASPRQPPTANPSLGAVVRQQGVRKQSPSYRNATGIGREQRTPRLVHASCYRGRRCRHRQGQPARPRPLRACLSRMRDVHVRF